MNYTFICRVCNISFVRERNYGKYCSNQCSRKSYSLNNVKMLQQYKSQYYQNNKERLNSLNSARYYQKRKSYESINCAACGVKFTPKRSDEKCCNKKCSVKKWNIENKDYNLACFRKRYLEDLNYRITQNMRSRINVALKKNVKSKKTKDLIGCSVDFLLKYLESKFAEGMSWENYGHSTWHIDHIIPLSSFDLIDPEQLAKACHYTNLQPLWATDNIVKGNKLPEAL